MSCILNNKMSRFIFQNKMKDTEDEEITFKIIKGNYLL